MVFHEPNPGIKSDLLVIESDEKNLRLIEKTFNDAYPNRNLEIIPATESAIDFLNDVGEKDYRTVPMIIMLALEMPQLNGKQVLQFIKKNKKLRVTPVIVLVSDGDTDEIRASYRLHANCVIEKPSNEDDFKTLLRETWDYWYEIAKLT